MITLAHRVTQQINLEIRSIQIIATMLLNPLPGHPLLKLWKELRNFTFRNSDGTFILDYVITPTLTPDIPKYERVAGGSGTPNIFDSTGQFFFSQSEITYNPDPELAYFGATAVIEAARISPKYDFNGPAFDGVLHVDVYESNQSGPKDFTICKIPPQVRFVGAILTAMEYLIQISKRPRQLQN